MTEGNVKQQILEHIEVLPSKNVKTSSFGMVN
jgi:hypothetical protein